MRILFILLFVSIQSVYAQDKIEREYKIKSAEVPKKASDFIKTSFAEEKVNWYMEESASGKSIEAKVQKEGRLYSAEFDIDGNIQDIEVLINIKEVPEPLKMTIERSLGEQFSRYKIQKVQKQWIGKAADLHLLIKGDEPKAKYKTNFEIVLSGRINKHNDEYELLFNEEGMLVRKQKIAENNQHHLLF